MTPGGLSILGQISHESLGISAEIGIMSKGSGFVYGFSFGSYNVPLHEIDGFMSEDISKNKNIIFPQILLGWRFNSNDF